MADDDLAHRIGRLEALEEIRQLAARYALALDSRDVVTLVSLFVEDVETGDGRSGRAALAEWFDPVLRPYAITFHLIGNHVIDFVDDDHATGIVYCRGEIQEGGRWIVQAIQYRDDYERRGGHWYFVRRKHLLWYGRDVGQSPLGLPPANWPDNSTGTGELPQIWPTWRAFWATGARPAPEAQPEPPAAAQPEPQPAPQPAPQPEIGS
jgi:hypothetical protein